MFQFILKLIYSTLIIIILKLFTQIWIIENEILRNNVGITIYCIQNIIKLKYY